MARILTLDVAFAHLGWAIMEPKDDDWAVLDAYVIETKKSDKKKKIRVADNDIRRSTEIFSTLSAIVARCDIKGVVAELPPGGGKSSISVKSMAMAVAAVACVVEAYGLPAEWTTPDEGKIAVCGTKKASKIMMMRQVARLYPESTKSFKRKVGSKTDWENRYEHTADAIAAFVSAKGGQLVRLMHQT